MLRLSRFRLEATANIAVDLAKLEEIHLNSCIRILIPIAEISTGATPPKNS